MQNAISTFTRQTIPADKLPSSLREKWNPSVLNEGFVPFPKKLLRCLGPLFDASDAIKELAVLLAVVDYKRPNLTRQPSLAYLSFVAGLSEGEFQAALQRLEAKGHIAVSGGPEELTVKIDKLLTTIEELTK